MLPTPSIFDYEYDYRYADYEYESRYADRVTSDQ